VDYRPRSTGRRGPNPSPGTTGTGGRPGAFSRFRLDRTLGFWLGGAVLGTAGCILGAAMPYRHPVAVTANVLWWGIFLGCLGASIGALLGLWAEQKGRSPPGPRRVRNANRRPVVRRAPSRFSTAQRRRF
jgi:hypothetical protein